MSILHGISSGVFYILFYIAGYRKAVVYDNIERSFPDKSTAEIDAIAKDFYRHFCDVIVESIRMFSIGEAEIKRRVVITNPEVMEEMEQYGKSIIMVTGHYNNWEMIGTFYPFLSTFQAGAPYGPLKNKFFDAKMSQSRSKFGLQLLPKHEAKALFERSKEEPTLFFFAADQSPTSSKKSFWMDFLNQDTAIAFGTEKFAQTYDCIVAFADIQKVKRGYYSLTYTLITADAPAEEHGFITRSHVQLLEKAIQKEPRYWLWSHKRWKRKRAEA